MPPKGLAKQSLNDENKKSSGFFSIFKKKSSSNESSDSLSVSNADELRKKLGLDSSSSVSVENLHEQLQQDAADFADDLSAQYDKEQEEHEAEEKKPEVVVHTVDKSSMVPDDLLAEEPKQTGSNSSIKTLKESDSLHEQEHLDIRKEVSSVHDSSDACLVPDFLVGDGTPEKNTTSSVDKKHVSNDNISWTDDPIPTPRNPTYDSPFVEDPGVDIISSTNNSSADVSSTDSSSNSQLTASEIDISSKNVSDDSSDTSSNSNVSSVSNSASESILSDNISSESDNLSNLNSVGVGDVDTDEGTSINKKSSKLYSDDFSNFSKKLPKEISGPSSSEPLLTFNDHSAISKSSKDNNSSSDILSDVSSGDSSSSVSSSDAGLDGLDVSDDNSDSSETLDDIPVPVPPHIHLDISKASDFTDELSSSADKVIAENNLGFSDKEDGDIEIPLLDDVPVPETPSSVSNSSSESVISDSSDFTSVDSQSANPSSSVSKSFVDDSLIDSNNNAKSNFKKTVSDDSSFFAESSDSDSHHISESSKNKHVRGQSMTPTLTTFQDKEKSKQGFFARLFGRTKHPSPKKVENAISAPPLSLSNPTMSPLYTSLEDNSDAISKDSSTITKDVGAKDDSSDFIEPSSESEEHNKIYSKPVEVSDPFNETKEIRKTRASTLHSMIDSGKLDVLFVDKNGAIASNEDEPIKKSTSNNQKKSSKKTSSINKDDKSSGPSYISSFAHEIDLLMDSARESMSTGDLVTAKQKYTDAKQLYVASELGSATRELLFYSLKKLFDDIHLKLLEQEAKNQLSE